MTKPSDVLRMLDSGSPDFEQLITATVRLEAEGRDADAWGWITKALMQAWAVDRTLFELPLTAVPAPPITDTSVPQQPTKKKGVSGLFSSLFRRSPAPAVLHPRESLTFEALPAPGHVSEAAKAPKGMSDLVERLLGGKVPAPTADAVETTAVDISAQADDSPSPSPVDHDEPQSERCDVGGPSGHASQPEADSDLDDQGPWVDAVLDGDDLYLFDDDLPPNRAATIAIINPDELDDDEMFPKRPAGLSSSRPAAPYALAVEGEQEPDESSAHAFDENAYYLDDAGVDVPDQLGVGPVLHPKVEIALGDEEDEDDDDLHYKWDSLDNGPRKRTVENVPTPRAKLYRPVNSDTHLPTSLYVGSEEGDDDEADLRHDCEEVFKSASAVLGRLDTLAAAAEAEHVVIEPGFAEDDLEDVPVVSMLDSRRLSELLAAEDDPVLEIINSASQYIGNKHEESSVPPARTSVSFAERHDEDDSGMMGLDTEEQLFHGQSVSAAEVEVHEERPFVPIQLSQAQLDDLADLKLRFSRPAVASEG